MAEISTSWRERLTYRLAGPLLSAVAALLAVLVSAPSAHPTAAAR